MVVALLECGGLSVCVEGWWRVAKSMVQVSVRPFELHECIQSIYSRGFVVEGVEGVEGYFTEGR